MFNYECYKQKGTVLGTCIDGFLFGACCRLPSALGTLETIDKEEEGGGGSDEEEEEERDKVNSLVMSSSESPSLERFDLDSPPTFLSDLLKEQTSPSPVSATSPASQSASSETSSVFIDSLDPLPQAPPSIILGNGSVVSLESLSVRPSDLLDPNIPVEDSSSTKAPERNQLFTWYAIDQLMGSTTTSTTTTSTSSTESSTKNASTSTPAPELPFLEDIAPMSSIVTTKKAENLPSSTTASSKETPAASSTSSTSTTSKTRTTTKSIEAYTKSGSMKWTSQSAYPDPFLDLSTTSTEQSETMR